MPNLEQTYKQLKEAKLKRKSLKDAMRDELAVNARYQELNESITKDREELKAIKQQATANVDLAELETINVEIKSLTEMLADVALNLYLEGNAVSVQDPIQGELFPQFTVKFKKN